MRAGFAFAVAAALLTAACAVPGGEGGGEPVEDLVGQSGGMCGGIAGIDCADASDYCAYDPGACKQIADASGICRARPQACTMDYAPVCGCDGNTYSNACAAAAAGVSVAAQGECSVEE